MLLLLMVDKPYSTSAKGLHLFLRKCKRVCKLLLLQVLCGVFKCVDKFYKTNDSDFIENIAIYSDDELNHELGYVVFTQIFIKTEIHFVNICEYTNKISIKETY